MCASPTHYPVKRRREKGKRWFQRPPSVSSCVDFDLGRACAWSARESRRRGATRARGRYGRRGTRYDISLTGGAESPVRTEKSLSNVRMVPLFVSCQRIRRQESRRG